MEQDREHYIVKGQERLRCGYTTGSCAAAAAKGAVSMLLSGCLLESVQIDTPKGWPLTLNLEDIQRSSDEVSCAVRKDSGDDPDITNGILIYARARRRADQGIEIEGGPGVGRVTLRGLSLEVGQAAINPVPQAMIRHEVNQVCGEWGFTQGITIQIFVPEGEQIARKTFNPRLGIVGGISIIGTSGIVEPMSEQAFVESIRLEMKMLRERGCDDLLVIPGNYGETFARESLNLNVRQAVKSSNFIGEVLDFAVELDFKSLLVVGHVGKTVKLAGGIMNLHSRNADGRMEILAAHAACHGADTEQIKAIMGCAMTDEAVEIIARAGLRELVFTDIAQKGEYYMTVRVKERIRTGLILFSNIYGQLGISSQGEVLLGNLQKQEKPASAIIGEQEVL